MRNLLHDIVQYAILYLMESRSLIKQLMKQKGLKTEDVASKAGCSYSTIIQWLAGKQLSDKKFEAIARALGLTSQELQSIIRGTHQAAG